jgi:hypothetical protein
MKLLIDINELNNYKSRDKIPCECGFCKKTFYQTKNVIQRAIKGTKVVNFCSPKCRHSNRIKKTKIICTQCNKQFDRRPLEIRPKNNFCSQRCSAKHYNAHKTHGYRRSKLEKYLELKLTELYPNLEIKYNNTSAILAELDIYFPTLNFAVELNGPFHYEPIYGLEKLTKTQRNDKRKILACAENGIELCIIDVSKHRYFKEHSSLEILEYITNIVNTKLNGASTDIAICTPYYK